MNSVLIFVIFLQVLTPLYAICTTSNGEEGVCKVRSECRTSEPLTKCNSRVYVCCPTRVVRLEDSRFPKDCGYTPLHPREQIFGGKLAEPDEYIWMASLRYRDQSIYRYCSASVINSRYLLTAAHCVTGDAVIETGGLIGARLGKFDEKGEMCDYGTKKCSHFEEYGIEKIIPHSDFMANRSYVGNDIALIRVDRPIQFSNVTQPICLPFGNKNRIYEPAVGGMLTVAGWGLTLDKDDTGKKHDATITLQDKGICGQKYWVDETHLCAVELGKNSCNGDSGGPLMNQFQAHYMVLEGIVSYGIKDCKKTTYPGVYTRVRSYGDWLREHMEM